MTNEKTGQAENGKVEHNIFRNSLLRYLGYANEVGESFRYQFPKFVTPSYIVAFGYCFADAATSGHSAFDEATKKGSPTAAVDSVVATVDTLIWQSLASVMIPGAIINAAVRASRFAVSRSPMVLPAMVSTWAPTAIGLGSVPLIIHPIDNAVDFLMDSTVRQIDWKNPTSSQNEEKVELNKKEIKEGSEQITE
jgi:fission process protein 1